MILTELQLFSYQLPLNHSLQIGRHNLNHREGLIVRINTDSGIHGFGEAAPLPGLHLETLTEVKNQLLDLRSLLTGTKDDQWFEILNRWYTKENPSPSTQFSIESALLNIIAQVKLPHKDINLPTEKNKKIQVNLLATGSRSAILKKIEQGLSEKFSSIKVKIGRNSLSDDIELIQKIQHLIGDDISLRLDANQSWEIEEAITFAKAVKDISFEYIEEPLKNPADLKNYYNSTALPIALDESLTEIPPEDLHLKNWISAIILKPSVIGSVRKILQYLYIAQKHGLKVVISDTFSSGVGLSFLIRLASTISEPRPMGFDTYSWLRDDILVNRLPIENGCFDLHTVKNLCEEVDYKKLEMVV